MRALKIAGAAVAAVIVIVAVLLILGIPSGFLTSAIQDRVERETGYRLTIAGSTKIGLWPSLNVRVNDVTLEAPKDRDASNRVTVGSVQADMTLKSVWSGHPQITELVITRPVLHHPLLRERERLPAPATSPAASSDGTDANALAIDRVTIVDGTMVMFNLRDRVENRIEGINAEALIGGDRKIKVSGRARAGEQPLKFAITATAPAPPLQRQNIPVELTLDASGLLQAPLAAKAEVRLNGSIVMINGVTGTLGDGAFNGWASVDLSSKPLVKLDLDFQRLEVATSKERATSASLGSQPWSNASIDLTGLNYVDAQLQVSAAELNIGEARFAPVAIDTAVAAGVLKTSFSNLGVYGGQASGQLIVDVTSGSPGYAFSSDLVGVRALPLLRSAADFDKLDGKMQAKMTLRSAGNSQRLVMSSLSGTVFVVFQDGGMAGGQGADHRSHAALCLVPHREGPGDHRRSQSGRPAGEDHRVRHHRSRRESAGVPGRTEARTDHRRPGPHLRSGRARHPRGDRRPLGRAADLSGYGRHPRQSRCGLRQAEGNGQGPVRQQWRIGKCVGRIDRIRRKRIERQRIGKQWAV